MKITENNKKTLQICVILLIAFLTFYNIFYSENIASGFSLYSIEEKKQNFDSLNDIIEGNESLIKDSKEKLESNKAVANSSNKELETLRARIDAGGLEFDMPSLLISLEQNAIKNNLEISIEYGKITGMDDTSIGANASGIMGEDMEHGSDLIGEVIDKMDKILGTYSAPQIGNINTTSIPFNISGKYSDIRRFIKYIDELEYVETGYMDLESNGEYVVGIIVINVFHGGEF